MVQRVGALLRRQPEVESVYTRTSVGNGRATALTFAREGAKVLCVDHNLASAEETVDMIRKGQGTAFPFKADVAKETDIKAFVADAHKRWGRIDILHNNVGVSISGGDAELLDITEQIAGAEARFLMADAGSPTLVRDGADESALYVLMPMRV